MISPVRLIKSLPRTHIMLFGLFFNSLSGCTYIDFYAQYTQTNSDITPVKQECFSSEDLQGAGIPDPCFGNNADEAGGFAFSLLPTIFKIFHTSLAGVDDVAINYMVTDTDEDGALWMAHPYLADNAIDIYYQISKLKPSQSNDPVPLTYLATDASGLALTDLLIDQKDDSNRRAIYYAGTIHTGAANIHQFFLCRLIEDLTAGTLTQDMSFGMITHCRYFPSASIGMGYNAIPASMKPVRICFHLGSDGVRRVILVGISSNGSDNITIVPVKISDGMISGPPGALNTITKYDIRTTGQGPTLASDPANTRSIRIFGLETDPLDGYSPSQIYVGFEFLNDEDFEGDQSSSAAGNFKTFDGPNPRAEHFIYRLNSNLSDTGFGQNYGFREGIYLPAETSDGTSQSFLNSRSISTASSLSTMRVSNGQIYVLGLHVDHNTLSSSPSVLGYKVLKYPTNANNSVASQTVWTSSATSCNLTANPSLAVSRDDLIVVGCSQSNTPDPNFLIREHSPANLAVLNRIGKTENEYSIMTKGFEGLTTHSPSLNLYYDEKLGGNILYRGWISLVYPQIIRTWQN